MLFLHTSKTKTRLGTDRLWLVTVGLPRLSSTRLNSSLGVESPSSLYINILDYGGYATHPHTDFSCNIYICIYINTELSKRLMQLL